MNVLIIEDEPSVQIIIKKILEQQEHKPLAVGTAAEATKAVRKNNLDTILLDLGLPDGDGFDLCQSFRKDNITTPIVILTAEESIDMKVKCLDAGADDYITKPFDSTELIARINAVTRRTVSNQQSVIASGEFVVDKINRSFTINGTDVKLTNNELDLLAYLMEREGTVISHYKLQEDLWDIDHYTPSNFIHVYLSYLRKKIREHSNHRYIKTIRNKGFVFNPPD